MSALVSLVVPAYNNEPFLGETIESCLAQTYSDIELIVADHSSTDATWDVMAGYADDPRVKLLRTEPGGGAPRNWNRVSQAARGEYIKLVCGDDLLHPEIVERQVAALSPSEDRVLAASARSIIDANGKIVIASRGLSGLSGVIDGAKAIRKTVRGGTNLFGEPGSVLMRRTVLERAGWWDSRWPYLLDEASYAAVLLQGKFVAVPGALASFRISDTQWSVRLVNQQSKQAAGFHHWMHSEHPAVISASDVRVGNGRAKLAAWTRRAAYVYLRNRMSKAADPVESERVS